MSLEALERARRLSAASTESSPTSPATTAAGSCSRRSSAEHEALTGLPWTGGFVAGQLWLAGEHEAAVEVDRLLAPRADAADDTRPRLPLLAERRLGTATSYEARAADDGSLAGVRSPRA